MRQIAWVVISASVALAVLSGGARSEPAGACDLHLRAGALIDGVTAQEGSAPGQDAGGGEVARKSVLRGMLFSALIPGLGEIYADGTRGYITGGIMAATDIFASLEYFTNNGKGDDRRKDYQQFGRSHYSRVRLERYVTDTVAYWSGSAALEHCRPGPTHDDELCGQEFAESFPLGGDGSDDFYQQIDADDRYVMGWDDWDPYQVLNNEVLWTSWNPGQAIPEGLPSTTAHREEYAGMREKANDYFSKADTYAWVMVIGRVVSMIDTAILVKIRNKDLAGFGTNPRLSFKVRSLGRPDFRVGLKVRF